MKFFYAMSMLPPADYLTLAPEVERCGFDGVCIPDSICYPKTSDTKYPYNNDGSREFLQGQPFIEPFSLIPAMAALTTHLRFRTLVYKLPIRNPVLAAKSATSVSVLSNNRFDFGVGLSPWPEDYDVCGQQWKARGRRMDEMLDILRGLSGGDFFSYSGEFYDILPIQLCPAPSEPAPILVGGHSPAALKRAALKADGWVHAGGDQQEMQEMIQTLQALRSEHGLPVEGFDIHVGSARAFSVDGLLELQAMGVTSVGVAFDDAYSVTSKAASAAATIEKLERYAGNVIDAFRAQSNA